MLWRCSLEARSVFIKSLLLVKAPLSVTFHTVTYGTTVHSYLLDEQKFVLYTISTRTLLEHVHCTYTDLLIYNIHSRLSRAYCRPL